MNNITDIGARYLASALASGTQPFTKLRIGTCNISEVGGVNIVESLAYDQGLRALEMNNNPLTLKVGIALHAALKTNFNIEYLSTQNCEFPARMAQFFNTIAYYNRNNKRTKLKYLNIEDLYDEIEEENVSSE
jgi:Ran GTPase-activating protein (RanGAP) involved in mRNA processing and transport